MRALQQAALPEIQAMLRSNPLSTYAAWSPRQIAGSNPAYDQLFAQAQQMGPALGGLNLIFGDAPQSGEGSMAVPNMGGAELLDWVYQRGLKMDILIITGSPISNMEEDIKDKGAFACIPKPFRLEHLSSMVQKGLKRVDSI